jgi:drug/metabolite transporter (DMT)-like permease
MIDVRSVDQPISQRAFVESILLMLGGALSLALLSLFGKDVGRSFSLPALIFVRMLVPCVLVGLWYLAFSRRSWAGGRIKPHLLRSTWAIGAQYCFFYVLVHTTLLNATLLFTTSGLFVPVIGRVVLGQELKRRTALAVLVAFVGVVITLAPHGSISALVIGVGLLSGFLNASSQVAMHRSAKSPLTPLQIALCMYAISSGMALVILVLTARLPHLEQVVFQMDAKLGVAVLLLAVFSVLNQVLRGSAYRRVNKPGSLVPFLYTSVAFAGLLDWLAYGVVPELHVYVGGAILFSGAAIMAIRRAPPTAPEVAS